MERGVEILSKHKEVGVVYGNLSLFGEKSESRTVPKFDIYRLLAGNFIDMCTMIRKEVWEDIGGFDEERKLMGFEDWEFWIRANEAGWKFYHVNETSFDYRIRPDSLLKQARGPERYKEMLQYVHEKHLELFVKSYKGLLQQYTYYNKDKEKPFRSFAKFLYKKYFSIKTDA